MRAKSEGHFLAWGPQNKSGLLNLKNGVRLTKRHAKMVLQKTKTLGLPCGLKPKGNRKASEKGGKKAMGEGPIGSECNP